MCSSYQASFRSSLTADEETASLQKTVTLLNSDISTVNERPVCTCHWSVDNIYSYAALSCWLYAVSSVHGCPPEHEGTFAADTFDTQPLSVFVLLHKKIFIHPQHSLIL